MGFTNGGGFVQAAPQDLLVPGSIIVNPGGGTLGGGSIIIDEVAGQAQIQFDSGAPRETERAFIFAAPDPLDVTRSDFLIESNKDGDRGLEIAMVPPTVIAGTPTRGTVTIGSIGTGVAFPNGVVANLNISPEYQTIMENTNLVATGNNALVIGDEVGIHVRYSESEIQAITGGVTPAVLVLQPSGSRVDVGAPAAGHLELTTSSVGANNGVAGSVLVLNPLATGVVEIPNSNTAPSGNQALLTGDPAGTHVRYSGAEILAIKAGPATSTLFLNTDTTEAVFAGVRSITLRHQSTTNLPGFTPGTAYAAHQSITGVFCPASGVMTAWIRFQINGNTALTAADFVFGAVQIDNTTQATTPFAASDNRGAAVGGTWLNSTTQGITVFTQITAAGCGNPGDSLTISAQFRNNSNAAGRFFTVSRMELGIIPSL